MFRINLKYYSRKELILLFTPIYIRLVNSIMKKNLFFLTICLLFSLPLLANSSSDSLEINLQNAKGKERIDILNQLSLLYQISDIEKSNSYAKKAFSLSELINYPEGKALALINAGAYYLSSDSITLAIHNIQRGLNLSKLSHYAYGIASGEFQMSRVYMSFSDYKHSLMYSTAALQIFDSISDLAGQVGSLIEIGDIYVEMGNFEDALIYYKKSLQLCNKLGNTETLAIVNSKLGLVYMYKKDLESALLIFDKAIESFSAQNLTVEELLFFKGKIFMEMDDYPNALKFFHESSLLANQNNNYLLLAEIHFELAQIFVKQRKYVDAQKYFQLSLEYSKKRNVKKLIADNYKGLSELYFALDNNLMAYNFQKQFAMMKDSVLNEETSRAIQDLKLKYQTEEIVKENEILKKNNRIQSLELSKHRYLAISLIAFVLGSLIVVFFIINLYRNNRKTNELLRQKNQEVNTQKSLLEDALSKLMISEKKNRAILTAIPDMMFLFNNEGVFLDTPDTDLSLFGKKYTSLNNKTLDDLFPDEVVKQFMSAIKKAQKTNNLEVIEFQLDIERQEKIFESRIVHKNDNNFISITRDMTERKKLERNLIKAKEEAENATKSKSMFLASMSHEIRTPMSGIIGISEVMKDTPLNSAQQEYLNIILTSANSLLSIINDILDFSKVEAGKLILDSRPFILTDVVHETTNMLLLNAKDKGIELFTSIAHNVPARINGDPNRLLQILLNLTNNALKFTHKGSVTIEVAVAEKSEKFIKLKFSVIDTGVGISDEEQNSLFKPFFQSKSGRISKNEGTGLGLSIVKNLVSLMKGQVGIKSNLGKGSTFWFEAEFGYAEEEVEVKAPVKIAKKHPKNLSKALNVLIAEDDPINQRLISIVIQRAGFSYDIAENGIEAVDLFMKNNYDVILMDIDMPKMDGLEATIRIREHEMNHNSNHKVGIIAVTAKAVQTDRNKCFQIGMNDFITKPFKSDDLLNSIDKHKLQ